MSTDPLHPLDITVVFGASDPEAEIAEHMALEAGLGVMIAHNKFGRRVSAPEAYSDANVSLTHPFPPPHTVVWFECEPDLRGTHQTIIIDHHAPEHPGYGQPPEKFLSASSVGQLALFLASRGVPVFDYIGPALNNPYFTLNVHNQWFLRDAKTGVRVPHNVVLAAAADHCLGAAYRGECPGVNPEHLMTWRAESRAKFQKRAIGAIVVDVKSTAAALRRAPRLCPICGGDPDSCSHNLSIADMRRDDGAVWPELPEAATYNNLAYMAGPLTSPDGRLKYTVSGMPEIVAAWMEHAATTFNLADIYGDPQRGFAGGYAKDAPTP